MIEKRRKIKQIVNGVRLNSSEENFAESDLTQTKRKKNFERKKNLEFSGKRRKERETKKYEEKNINTA